MGETRRLTDVEMRAFLRQRTETRRAVLALFGLVGGLSALAVALVTFSRNSRADLEEAASVAPTAASRAAAAEARQDVAAMVSRPDSSLRSAPGLLGEPATSAAFAAPAPAPFAGSDEIRRAVRDQKQAGVQACLKRATKRSSRKAARVTVKVDVQAPAKVAKIDVSATPRSTSLVKCVKAELKDLVVPKVASHLTVTVPFQFERARGRRPAP